MRTESIGVAFLVNSLGIGGAEKHTLQHFNSLDDARFWVAIAYLKRYEHLLAHVTPDRASQVWCADFGREWDFYGLNRQVRQPLSAVLWPYRQAAGGSASSGHRNRPQLRSSARRGQENAVDSSPPFQTQPSGHLRQRSPANYLGIARYQAHRGAGIHSGIDIGYFSDRYSAAEKAGRRARYGLTPMDFVVGICAKLRPKTSVATC